MTKLENLIDKQLLASYHDSLMTDVVNPVKKAVGAVEMEFIDLGLPSGLLWAKYNLGASEKDYYGWRASWGNTIAYSDRERYNFSSVVYHQTPANSINTNLTLEHDVIQSYLGNDCRLPTKEDVLELINPSYTKSEWINNYGNISGLNGRLITSNINGNSIFFPAEGLIMENDVISYLGQQGYYWTSSFSEISENRLAAIMLFTGNFCVNDLCPRSYGLSLRAVSVNSKKSFYVTDVNKENLSSLLRQKVDLIKNATGDNFVVTDIDGGLHDCGKNPYDYVEKKGETLIFEYDGIYQVKDNFVYPTSHPDLSTQPSILPQRFGNLNIYEVLSRIDDGCYTYLGELEYEADSKNHLNVGRGNVEIILVDDVFERPGISMHDPVITLGVELSYDECHLNGTLINGTEVLQLEKILLDSDGKFAFYINDGGHENVLQYTYNVQGYLKSITFSSNNGSVSFGIISNNTCTLDNRIKFVSNGSYATNDNAIVDYQTKSYIQLIDLELNARPLLTSAFNVENCEPVKIGKEKNGDWSIKQELDFTPDFVLCQYYKNGNDYYYNNKSYEDDEDDGTVTIIITEPGKFDELTTLYIWGNAGDAIKEGQTIGTWEYGPNTGTINVLYASNSITITTNSDFEIYLTRDNYGGAVSYSGTMEYNLILKFNKNL